MKFQHIAWFVIGLNTIHVQARHDRDTTTILTFRGGCLLPPKVTFRGGFGCGGSLYKTASNSIDAKSFEF